MDENIDNYSLSDLYEILNINESATKSEANDEINQLIEKLKKQGNNDLVDFFEKAREKIIDNIEEKKDQKTDIIDDTIIERKFLNIKHNKNITVTQDHINPNYKNIGTPFLITD